jgi:membrane protein implicated in regulation of membrane protease activity
MTRIGPKAVPSGSGAWFDGLMQAWLIWLIVAAVLAGAETLSLDLVLIMCAGGAAAGGISAAAGLPPAGQVAIAIAGALALLLFLRPVAKRHLTSSGTARTGVEALIGAQAIVTSKVDARDGRVRLGGSEWSAKAYDSSQVIPVGSSVQVIEISGATAIVWDSSS